MSVQGSRFLRGAAEGVFSILLIIIGFWAMSEFVWQDDSDPVFAVLMQWPAVWLGIPAWVFGCGVFRILEGDSGPGSRLNGGGDIDLGGD